MEEDEEDEGSDDGDENESFADVDDLEGEFEPPYLHSCPNV